VVRPTANIKHTLKLGHDLSTNRCVEFIKCAFDALNSALRRKIGNNYTAKDAEKRGI